MNKATLINGEEWEGLFINGKLVEEKEVLNEGNDRVKYFLELAKKYEFNLEEMNEYWVNDKGDTFLNDYGCFPEKLYDFQGMYELR